MIKGIRYSEDEIIMFLGTKDFPEKYNERLRITYGKLEMFCYTCNEWKEFDKFHKRDNPLGKELTCGTCNYERVDKIKRKEYKEKHRDEKSEYYKNYSKEYYRMHKQQCLESNKKWLSEHPTYRSNKYHEALALNPDLNKHHYQEVIKHPDYYPKHLEAGREWRARNPGWWKKYANKTKQNS